MSTTIPLPFLPTQVPALAAPTHGLKHIIFDNTGTAKAASTFNLNIEAISEYAVNHLKFDCPLTALAICKLKAPTIVSIPPSVRLNQPCQND
jgi:hypothetical protein